MSLQLYALTKKKDLMSACRRKLFSRSDLSRVEGVDFHPTVPWFLTGLYNHETEAIVNTSDSKVAEVPVCCVRFITSKSWFIAAGSDDFHLRVFNS